jgi:cyclopropane-fatty-acyl-phospholipid synthase
MRSGPVAAQPERPNDQHYELPPAFFERVLGPRLKYSAAHWPGEVDSLAEAEESMLALTCRRAGIRDGQRILELGCGWGSLTLWMAEHHPDARITAVSNSVPQRLFIEARAAARGLENVAVVTEDMNDFRPDGAFDRIVSVEMFEHMRNWEELLARVGGWLAPEGRLFLHVFSHRRHPYLFEDRGPGDWMARHFFTAGLMPSQDLLGRLSHPLEIREEWRMSGLHYRKTAEAWLERMDGAREEILEIFRDVYGPEDARRWFHRWRLFFLAVAELFGYREGREWGISHYRLAPAGAGDGPDEGPPHDEHTVNTGQEGTGT